MYENTIEENSFEDHDYDNEDVDNIVADDPDDEPENAGRPEKVEQIRRGNIHKNLTYNALDKAEHLSIPMKPLFDVDMISNSSANLRVFNLRQEKIKANQHLIQKAMPRVLVICTGGTLTMIHTP